MKKILLLALFASLFSLNLSAQEKCVTMPVLDAHIQDNPAIQAAMERAEAEYYQWRKSGQQHNQRAVISIPTVVHVVYTNATDNISNAQIMSQLEVLNADYRRLNADTANTRAIFKSIAADTEIEFCLATTDPSGNPTTGITRTLGNPGFLGFYDPITNGVKSNSSGGKDPWPRNEYLNIWVCPLFPIVLGYAQFPWDAPATDGVVIGHTAFGTTGTAASPSDGGRTSVHEVGHWLGLRHIWGDGDCTATDSVIDTPNADAAGQTDCNLTRNTCVDTGAVDPPDMAENYMDYSSDDCMNAFTKGQKDRMLFYLTTWRAGLITSNGCSLPATAVFEEKAERMLMYPNPAMNQVNLDIPVELGQLQSVRLFNVAGQELPCTYQGQGNLSMDVSGLQPGIYFVEVKTDQGSTTKKLLVNPR